MNRILLVTFLALAAVAAIAAEPQTVTKAGTSASNAVAVQGVTGGVPLDVNATVTVGDVIATNPSVTSTGNTVPGQATFIAGSSSGNKLLAPYVMTSTPSGAEPGLVVRMPAGASGLTNTELRAAPITVSSTQVADLTQTVAGGVGSYGVLSLGRDPDGVAYPIGIGYDNSVFTAPAAGKTWPVSGTFWPTTQTSTITGSVAVTGPLTNAEARASPLPVQATVTSTTITGSVAVTGPLTNAELRASPVPVQATVTSTTITGSVAVTGPLTNAEARASPLPVQATVTSTTITGNVAVTGTFWQATQPVSLTGQSVTSTGLAQGSSLTGATGPLDMAAVSSTAPAYTTATVQPLSVTNTGYLRVSEISDLTTAVTSTTATALTQWIAASGSNKVLIKFAQCSSSAASTTTANEHCQLVSGTGSNCGSNTALLASCLTPANGGCNWHDLVAPASSAICFRHAAAGTKVYTISYRFSP